MIYALISLGVAVFGSTVWALIERIKRLSSERAAEVHQTGELEQQKRAEAAEERAARLEKVIHDQEADLGKAVEHYADLSDDALLARLRGLQMSSAVRRELATAPGRDPNAQGVELPAQPGPKDPPGRL